MPTNRTAGTFDFEVDHGDRNFPCKRKVTGTKYGKKQIIFITEDISEIDQGAYTKETICIMEDIAKDIARRLLHKHFPL